MKLSTVEVEVEVFSDVQKVKLYWYGVPGTSEPWELLAVRIDNVLIETAVDGLATMEKHKVT